MSKVEILCVTMHQKDLSKFYEMNIQSDVVFANQSNFYKYEEDRIDDYNVKMITTAQRGVGKNRNTALLHAQANICLFADDDVVYYDDYQDIIVKAFDSLPNADVLIFNLVTKSNRAQKLNKSIKLCRIWDIFSFGTYRIAFKLDSIKKANIWFNLLFGGGCKYPSGEDSLWLIEAINKGLRVYTYPDIIGEVKHDGSTWFDGYNEKFFFGKGAWVQASLRKHKYLIFLYYIVRFNKLSDITSKKMFQLLVLGAKSFEKGLSYNDL